ncbi:MAG: hypothetical protein QGG02_16005 [Gammaproteobacteria bacterium]|jgi:hypothetical protein|nr:hypothetical protein [Gammaproteobacteria bacterium]MDP6732983.1 hypothetical protein [Gammaproteobacteria bacterium]|tara:strand:+ start:762 stop:1070 length:309 start_codon:yes stop_codon:yes gene_type:complete
MSDKDQLDNDPERTLITLEQLSQTIEVMTSVVNRLRQHLSEQLRAQIQEQQREEQLDQQEPATKQQASKTPLASENQQRERFVVEIKQQETEPVRKSSKTLH